MERILRILSFAVSIAFVAPSLAANVTLTISPSERIAYPGQNISINVYMNPSGNKVAGWQFDLKFDPKVLHAQRVIVYNVYPCDHTYSNGTIDNSNGIIDNVYSAALGSGCNTTSPGIIATINFTTWIMGGTTILDLLNVEVSDTLSNPLPKETQSGKVIHMKPSYHDVAEHWAPIWLHDTDDTDYRADYITNVDYDGDWIGNNNWENKDNYPLRGYIYYSVIETPTHYFVMYADFHPRDWSDHLGYCAIGSECHENDMEGALVTIEKDGSYYGSLVVVETEAHTDFYQGCNKPGIGGGSDNCDAGVSFYNYSHPRLYVESKGHGVCPWDYSGSLVCNHPTTGAQFSEDMPGGDGIVYYPVEEGAVVTQAEEPASGNDRQVYYELVHMKELWSRRCDVGNGHLYDSPFTYSGYRYSFGYQISGAFDGDTYGTDSANPPWGWDDSNDGNVYKGDMFLDPAHSVSTHLTIPGAWSLDYMYNPYLLQSPPPVYSINATTGSGYINVSWFFHPHVDNSKAAVYLGGSRIATVPKITDTRTYTNATSIQIPDNLCGSPAEVLINVQENVTITQLDVYVDITHPRIGDLNVELVHPDGTADYLFNRSVEPFSGEKNIKKWYYDRGIFSLKQSQGVWKLRVSDCSPSNVGTVNKVSLRIITEWGFYKITGLSPSTTYTVGIRTVDSCGNENQTFVNITVQTPSGDPTKEYAGVVMNFSSASAQSFEDGGWPAQSCTQNNPNQYCAVTSDNFDDTGKSGDYDPLNWLGGSNTGGIYSAIRTDSDPSNDATGSSSYGYWGSYAAEEGGYTTGREKSAGWALTQRTFDLDDYINFSLPSISITGATLKFDYKFYSTDYDDCGDYVFFYMYIRDECNGTWYKLSGSGLGTWSYCEDGDSIPDGSYYVQVWDGAHRASGPGCTLQSYGEVCTYDDSSISGVIVGGGTTTLADFFNSYCTSGANAHKFTLRFKIFVRLAGDPGGDRELYYFMLDDARIELSYQHNETEAPRVEEIQIIPSAQVGNYLAPPITIRAKVGDSKSGIDSNSCEYSLGSGWQSASYDGTYCYATISPSDGPRTFNIRVRDNAWNYGYGIPKTSSGFLRIWDMTVSSISSPMLNDLYNVSTYLSPSKKVVYRDSTYPTSWVSSSVSDAIRNDLVNRSFTVKNASGLKSWMDLMINSMSAPKSVVVMSQDVCPDTVCETNSTSATIRKYLDAGGRVVWIGDWPFYYQGHSGGSSTVWGADGMSKILGFTSSSISATTVTITSYGSMWGLTQTWGSTRPVSASSVTTNLAYPGTDNTKASAWHKSYNSSYIVDGTPPSTPSLTVIADSTSQITVTATQPSDSGIGLHDEPYQFFVDGSPQPWSSSNIYVHSAGLSPNEEHCYRVRCRDGLGNIGSESSQVCNYTLANPPSAGPFGTVTETSIVANWGANGNPNWTQYRATADGRTSEWINALSYNFTGLTPNTTYHFYVKAANGRGIETSQIYLGSKTTLARIPAQLAASDITSTSAKICWNSNGNPSGTVYEVFENDAKVWSGTDTCVVRSNLETGTSYMYKVRAMNAEGIYTSNATIMVTTNTTLLWEWLSNESRNWLGYSGERIGGGGINGLGELRWSRSTADLSHSTSVGYGASGIISSLLLRYNDSQNQTDLNMIKEGINWLLNTSSVAKDFDGNGITGSGELAWTQVEGVWEIHTGYLDGVTGIVDVLFDAYSKTGNLTYANAAREGVRWLLNNTSVSVKVGEVRKERSEPWKNEYVVGYGYGVAGISYHLVKWYEMTGDSYYLEAAREYANWLLSNSTYVDVDGDGKITGDGMMKWKVAEGNDTFYLGLAYGTAGVVRSLLKVYSATGDGKYLNASREGGNWLVSKLNDGKWEWMEGSSQYVLGKEHGVAGIIDVLLELYAATGEQKYRNAALSAGEWLMNEAIDMDGDGQINGMGEAAWKYITGYDGKYIGDEYGSAGILDTLMNVYQFTQSNKCFNVIEDGLKWFRNSSVRDDVDGDGKVRVDGKSRWRYKEGENVYYSSIFHGAASVIKPMQRWLRSPVITIYNPLDESRFPFNSTLQINFSVREAKSGDRINVTPGNLVVRRDGIRVSYTLSESGGVYTLRVSSSNSTGLHSISIEVENKGLIGMNATSYTVGGVLGLSTTIPSQVYVNENINYYVTITNNGDAPVEGAVLTVSYPPEFAKLSGDTPLTVGILQPHSSNTTQYVFRASSNGTYTVCSNVTTSNAGEISKCDQITVMPPQLSVSTELKPSRVARNQIFYFNVTVSNAGNADASGVVLDIGYPSNISLVSGTDPLNIGTIPAGGSVTSSYQLKVVSGWGSFTLWANVTSSNAGKVNKSSTVTCEGATLSVSLSTNPSSVALNQIFYFNVTVSNTGLMGANNVYVEIGNDSNTIMVYGTSPYTIAYLAPGSSALVSYRFKVVSGFGSHTLTAYVSSPDLNVTNSPLDFSESVECKGASISASTTLNPSSVALNQIFYFNVTVSNTGLMGANSVVVDLINDSSTQIVSGTDPFTISYLAPGGSYALSYRMKVTGGFGYHAIQANISSSDSNVTSSKGSSSSIQVRGAELSSASEVNPSTVGLNEQFYFNVTITNNGLMGATNTVLDIVNDSSTQIVSGTDPITISYIAPGGSYMYSYVMKVTGGFGSHVIEGRILASDSNVSSVSNTSSSITVSGPSLSVSMKANKSKVSMEENFEVTVNVTNVGNTAAQYVVLDLGYPGITLINNSCGSDPYTLGVISPNQVKQCVYVLKVSRGSPAGTYVIWANVSSTNAASVNASMSIFALSSNLKVNVISPTIVANSSNFTYDVHVYNTGDGNASGVGIKLVLPSSIQSYNQTQYSIGTLGPNENSSMAYVLKPTQLGEYTIYVNVTTSNGANISVPWKLNVMENAGVNVEVSPSTLISGKPATLLVNVTKNGLPFAGATVIAMERNGMGIFASPQKSGMVQNVIQATTNSSGMANLTITPTRANQTSYKLVVRVQTSQNVSEEKELNVAPVSPAGELSVERYNDIFNSIPGEIKVMKYKVDWARSGSTSALPYTSTNVDFGGRTYTVRISPSSLTAGTPVTVSIGVMSGGGAAEGIGLKIVESYGHSIFSSIQPGTESKSEILMITDSNGNATATICATKTEWVSWLEQMGLIDYGISLYIFNSTSQKLVYNFTVDPLSTSPSYIEDPSQFHGNLIEEMNVLASKVRWVT